MGELLRYTFLSVPLIGAFAIFALGISVIYRASRVLNLAHGAMAMFPAYISYSLVKHGVPMVVALPIAILTGATLGVLVERVFIRRLRNQGPTAQTVGTVAVAGLVIAAAAKIWGTTPIANAPRVFPDGQLCLAHSCVRWGDIGLFLVGLAVAASLTAFFKLSDVGLAMRGAAENRTAASILGVNPDIAAAGAWALGGGLAAFAGVMLAAVSNLDPYNLSLQVLPAFVAVLIGRLESLPGAVGGSVIAGLAFGFAPGMARIPGLKVILANSGAPQLVLTVLALVVMAMRGSKLMGSADTKAAIAGRAFRAPSGRRFNPFVLGGIALVLLVPWIVPFNYLGDALLAMELAIVAASLVVLIGWVGQISLAQASFVGVGALVTGIVTRSLGLGFPINIVIGALAAGAAAMILGVVALRVRGLYLAVATLIFAWMCDQFLFRSPWLGASTGSSVIPAQQLGVPGASPALDLTQRRPLYFVILAVLVLIVAGLANLRDTKVGRAFFAVRGSEMAASSLGIDVTRYKLIAFAVSGVVAGLGGSILMVEQRAVVPAQFLFTVSLQYLAISVVGGLTSLGGAIGAGLLFAMLNELFFSVRALAGWLEVVSAGLLALVLLAYPGGLSALADQVRTLAARLFGRRRRAEAGEIVPAEDLEPVRTEAASEELVAEPEPSPEPVAGDWLATATRSFDAPATGAEVTTIAVNGGNGNGSHTSPDGGWAKLLARPFVLPADRDARRPLVEAEGIVVRFGGLTAVKNASLSVREGEIVGLIGPNGAGKTTLFNAILGMNSPAEGRISLYGTDATALPAHLRARLGVGRTFQVLQLFNELTVFDNLLVATHLHNTSTLASNLIASSSTVEAEQAARKRVHDVLRLLDLDELANESVKGLPFGVLRMVELGRALVTGARLLMLDEIASGLNNNETEDLGKLIKSIRSLGVSILLIEHDVKMVVEVSDYVYVLDQGAMIAEGPPGVVQRDPHVIAAYLGGAGSAEAASAQPVPAGARE